MKSIGGRRLGTTSIAALSLWIASSIPTVAHAQNAPGPSTGPDAEPPVLPPYARPSDDQGLVPPLAPSPPQIRPSPFAVHFDEIRIAAPADGTRADPPAGWQPPASGQSGLIIAHEAGEPLDRGWVERQFAQNRPGGSGLAPERALALVELINRAFVSAGFVNSGLLVSPQDPAQPAVLQLRLVYGRLAETGEAERGISVAWVDGAAKGLDDDFVRNRFPSSGSVPLNASEIERDFRLLADHPAIRTVNASLVPGTRPGEAGLLITVLPESRFDWYLSAANSRSPSVGGERIATGGYFRNLLNAGDLVSAEAGLTEGLFDISFGYETPFFDPLTRFVVRGTYNDAAVIDRPLRPLDIESRDRSIEGGFYRVMHQTPLAPREDGGWSPAREFSVGVLGTWRRQRSFLFGRPFSFAPGSVDGLAEYGAMRVTVGYVERNVDQVLAATLTGTIGIAGTQSRLPGVANPDEDFMTLLAQINFARRLNASGLELRARLAGQLSNSVLYSGERLSIGGADSVRGYRENLLLGDQGVIGSIELAQPFSIGPRREGRFNPGAFSVSVFADAGYSDNVDIPDPPEQFLASVGVSLAWTPSDAITARISYAEALTNPPQAGTRDMQDRGIHFRITIFPLALFR